MGNLILLLLTLWATLTGCVVTYDNFPDASVESLPKDHEPKPLTYHMDPIQDDWFRSIWGKGEDEDYEKFDSLLMVLAPNWYPLGSEDFFDVGIQEVPRTLESSGMFSELILGESSPQGTGSYVKILFYDHPPSKGAKMVVYGQMVICVIPPLCPLAMWGIIPYYTDEGGLTVWYKLYQDGRGPYRYSYRIAKKGAGGLLLLPFAWFNFFTDDLNDALRAATLQFLIEAHRDGHL